MIRAGRAHSQEIWEIFTGHETKDASDPGFHGETGYPDPGRAI